MTETDLSEIISDVLSKYVIKVWITPNYVKNYIPAENLLPLKDDLIKALKGREKFAKAIKKSYL